MLQRALAASAVAALLVFAPPVLTAQEREVRGTEQSSALDWFSGIWADFTVWFGSHPPESALDGRCDVDPNGCPDGVAAPAQLLPDSFGEGTCSVDPNGCPGGA